MRLCRPIALVSRSFPTKSLNLRRMSNVSYYFLFLLLFVQHLLSQTLNDPLTPFSTALDDFGCLAPSNTHAQFDPNTVTDFSPLRPGPQPTLDPFLFVVYHKDDYPAGNERMEAPRRGNGADFDPDAPYRMYHGNRVPGFPQHPHRGFETLTATMTGLIDHCDSVGNAGRYGQGDLQWMTAGQGIVHSEMFPLVNATSGNPTRFFQIWLNLPARSKMVEPAFVMHWASQIPTITSQDGLARVTIWAGQLDGVNALEPTPNSWAADPRNEVAVWLFRLSPGGSYIIPPTQSEPVNRALYFVEGSSISVGDRTFKKHGTINIRANAGSKLSNDGQDEALVLLLQGRPINEPVAQYGPFVMNTREEIQQAYSDYRRTQFGGWPWPRDDNHLPRDKPRHALVNGKEYYPPDE